MNYFVKPNEQRTSLLGLCHGENSLTSVNYFVKQNGRPSLLGYAVAKYHQNALFVNQWAGTSLPDCARGMNRFSELFVKKGRSQVLLGLCRCEKYHKSELFR